MKVTLYNADDEDSSGLELHADNFSLVNQESYGGVTQVLGRQSDIQAGKTLFVNVNQWAAVLVDNAD